MFLIVPCLLSRSSKHLLGYTRREFRQRYCISLFPCLPCLLHISTPNNCDRRSAKIGTSKVFPHVDFTIMLTVVIAKPNLFQLSKTLSVFSLNLSGLEISCNHTPHIHQFFVRPTLVLSHLVSGVLLKSGLLVVGQMFLDFTLTFMFT